MKLSVIQENLKTALQSVSRVVGSRTSLPVLANVLLSTKSGRLELSATNLEMAISYQIGAKIEKEGSLSVPARLFTDLISSLPNDKLLLNAAGMNMQVKTTNFESTINGIASEEFPTIPKVKPIMTLKLGAEELVGALTEVSFAAAVDEARPVLSGVVFSIDKKQLTLAATDSYRLAESVLILTSTQTKELDFIVPAKTITELIRILGQDDVTVEIAVAETEILFSVGDIQLVSRLIEGKFPDYKKIIPEKNETEMVISTAELTSNIKIASLFARESANTIKLSFEKDKLVIASSAAQVGDNQSEIESTLVGDPGDISLNAKYLLDVLNVIKSSEVKLGISGKLNPCLIQPIGDMEHPYAHIIMPLRS